MRRKDGLVNSQKYECAKQRVEEGKLPVSALAQYQSFNVEKPEICAAMRLGFGPEAERKNTGIRSTNPGINGSQ